MKDETQMWLRYSTENLDSANILLESKLYNPCLQNIQQAVEKALKAILIENEIQLKKTHDILELKMMLKNNNIEIDLSDEGCDFLNSIYLPSKYPIGSVIPDYNPDDSVCKEALTIALNARKSILGQLK